MNRAAIVALEAFLLPKLEARFGDAMQRHTNLPRLRIGLRIFECRLVLDRIRPGARVPLDHVQLIVVHVVRRVETSSACQGYTVDNQRVYFSALDSVVYAYIDSDSVFA